MAILNTNHFTKFATQNMAFLSKALKGDILITGIENTTTLLYRDKYKNLVLVIPSDKGLYYRVIALNDEIIIYH